MPMNGWYNINNDADNVMDDGSLNGWADQSTQHYNAPNGNNVANGRSYRFGPVINYYGTWGQLIYEGQQNLAGADLANPSGLNGRMPANNNIPGNSSWVQGHLVNGECGGSGAIAANLTPITHNLNMLHAGYEAVIQRLVNRGDAAGSSQRMFNPNNIPNTRLIYRTHAVAPPVSANHNTVPAGLVISLGFVKNGVMLNQLQMQNEFTNDGSNAANPRLFATRYYTNDGANDRARILLMIGGVYLGY